PPGSRDRCRAPRARMEIGSPAMYSRTPSPPRETCIADRQRPFNRDDRNPLATREYARPQTQKSITTGNAEPGAVVFHGRRGRAPRPTGSQELPQPRVRPPPPQKTVEQVVGELRDREQRRDQHCRTAAAAAGAEQ